MSRNKTAETKEILGLNRITRKRILELCKKDKLYQTPELNDVLYLHYQGFQSIECLEDYTELKCLWLECNAISEIQGLDNQSKLKCLFLQSNLIKKMENLQYCKDLDTINLSQNHIRKIENCGFEVLPVLNTLNISSNYLKDCESLKELENCRNLSVLDLSNNRIDDILVVKIFAKMPELKVLVLQGNPVVSKIPQYRKTLILECKKLTYLDSRPVFPKDRACAEAWKRGGYAEERKENERWNRKERRKMKDSVNATIRMRNKNRKPEDQLSLLISSDSEDETDVKKRKKENKFGVDESIDSIWDEVAEDSKSDIASSKMSNSSSTSVISTTDSNDSVKGSSTDEEKDLLKKGYEICHVAECDNMQSMDKEIEEHVVTVNKLETEPENCEKILTKTLYIYDDMSNTPDNRTTNIDSDEDSKDQYQYTSDVISQVAHNNLSETDSYLQTTVKRVELQIENFNGSENESYEPFKELEKAMNSLIKKVDLDRETSRQTRVRSPKYQNITEKIQYEQECSAVNQQLKKDFEQLSANMDSFRHQLNKDEEERKEAITAFFGKKELSNENSSNSSENETDDNLDKLKLKKWDKITSLKKGELKLEHNEKREVPVIWINDKPFEEVEKLVKQETVEGTKIGLEQLEKDGEKKGLTSMPKIPLMQEKELRKNISENSLQICEIQQKSQQKINEDESSQNIPKTSEETRGFYTRQEIQKFVSNLDDYLESNKSSKATSASDHDGNDLKTSSLNSNHKFNEPTPMEDVVNLRGGTADDKSQYDPMDIELLTRNSDDALIALEKESKTLKELLQKLENKNGDLQEMFEKDFPKQEQEEEQTRDSKKSVTEISDETKNRQLIDAMDETEVEQIQETESLAVSKPLLEKIIQSLDLKPLKPKSYEFEIESDEECIYSEIKTEEAVPFQNISDVVAPFKHFLKNVALKNREELRRESLEKSVVPCEERKQIINTREQKPVSLQELVNQPHLKDVNNDTHTTLDEQLKKIKDAETKKIRRLVDCVYSQKDRYDDSLEVVDGKLMIRDKDSGEIKELPQPVGDLSDSDTDYDTAQSEEEEEGACCIRPKQKLIYQSTDNEAKDTQTLGDTKNKTGNSKDLRINWKFKADKNDTWSIPYKPTQRKYSNDFSQIMANDFNESDDSNDEFYSLDPQGKRNLYANIDDEFFHTLTLEPLKLTEQDENHILQCTRSYEELKEHFKHSKEESCLTEEESKLLGKMIENKSETNLKTLAENNHSNLEELLLLKKMEKRTKEKNCLESQNPDIVENHFDDEMGKPSLQLYKEAVKIFECNSENNAKNSILIDQKETGSFSDLYKTTEYSSAEVSGKNILTFIFEDSANKNEIEEHLDHYEDSYRQEQRNFDTTEINSPKSSVSISCLEKLSEEEKNEVESNIDVEGIAMNHKLEYVSEKECLEEKACDYTLEHPGNILQSISDLSGPQNEKLPAQEKAYVEKSPTSIQYNPSINEPSTELPTSEITNDLSSSYLQNSANVQSNTPEIDVLECNLEIFGCNDEIIENITVNAEVHYDY